MFVRDFRPVRRRAANCPARPAAPARCDDDLLLPAASAGYGPGGTASPPVWEVRSPFPTRDDGRTLALDHVEVYPDAATPVVAGALAMRAGAEVWVRSRRFMLDGKPVMLAASYLPADIVDGSPITGPDAGPGGTYAHLGELGHAPVRVTEELRARMPLRHEATELRLPAGTAVIVLCRTALDAEGRPVEFTKTTMDADAYVLEYSVDP